MVTLLVTGFCLQQVCTCDLTPKPDRCLTKSRFAFRFLFSMYQYLKKQRLREGWHEKVPCFCTDAEERNCQANGCHLRRLIESTCQSHLLWVLERTKTQKHIFSTRYWVSGDPQDEFWPTSASSPLLDTPFQLLKILDPLADLSLFRRWRKFLPETSLKNLQARVEAWVESLD